ncbi:MAG TPA: DUF2953 domain-containing protein [Sphingobacteriaceae bacterium]|nr:DUF2953 domain-containing protein [Sphingobacteriaceae bacterium]
MPDLVRLLPVLPVLAAAAYGVTRLPVRVAFRFRWPGRGAFTWSPGRLLRISIQFRVTGLRVTAREITLSVRTLGQIYVAGRRLYRREQERRHRWPGEAGPGSRESLPGTGSGRIALQIEALRWHTVIGAGDAAWTGIMAGMAWTCKGAVAGALAGSRGGGQWPRITVEPRFREAVFDTACHCILVWRLWDIIRAALAARAQPKPRRHKGVEPWTTPSKA